MSTPVAAEFARRSRRGLCAAVALLLSLACLVLAFAATTTPMTGMVEMAGTSATGAAAASADPVEAFTSDVSSAAGGGAREAAGPAAVLMSATMGSMCDSACVDGLLQVCTIAAALTATTLLALLLARRDTLLGLLARTRSCAVPCRRPRRTPWTVLSPVSLCVLRV